MNRARARELIRRFAGEAKTRAGELHDDNPAYDAIMALADAVEQLADVSEDQDANEVHR